MVPEDDNMEDLSYSFYAERRNNEYNNITNQIPKNSSMENLLLSQTPPNPMDNLIKRTRERWVEDSAVSKCHRCKTTFRIYRRRHHCKNCALIFCDYCTTYRNKIPKVIKKIPTRSGTEEPIDYNKLVRLCFNCFTHYETIHRLEKLLTVFSLMDLDIFDFKNLSMVCKAWRPMALFYLSKFREIQYKLPNYCYNSWEKQALWSNRIILKTHSIWEVHVLRSLRKEKNNKKFKEVVDLYYGEEDMEGSLTFNNLETDCIKDLKSCWYRMCSRYCCQKLDPERALLLLEVLDNADKDLEESLMKVGEEIVKAFDICDDYILECYLPYILFKLVSSKNFVIKNWIFQRCSQSIRLANSTYWYLKNESKPLFSELCEKLPQFIFSKLIKVQSFVELINYEEPYENIVSPVNPELGEQNVNQKGITIKKSATKPTFIPCDKSSILFKKDDIRKDYIIISIIRLMEKILQDAGLDIAIVTYNVQPTSDTTGFIQIVKNCETLYCIMEKLNTTIINYLMKHNPDESVGKLRNRFKNSCAIYSVIAFLLSISDRNTENLMLTTKGDLFHIDFGFVCGEDPKILKTSCIRITPQMLDALGGPESKEYEEFKELCGTVYDILRRHVNTFTCLLSLLPTYKSSSRTSPTVDEKAMMTEIVKRFCPGETYEDAIRNLKTRIDESSNNSTFAKYHIIDFFHKHNRESTVSNFLGNTIVTTYKGTMSAMSGIYSYFV